MFLYQYLYRWLYTLTFTLLIPFILVRLLIKSRLNPEYRHRWLERFGIFPSPKQTGGIWLHAVSVGETLAAITLIQALQKRFPNLSMTVTSTTPTGSAQVKRLCGDKVFHVYFPYDLPFAVIGFLKRIKPILWVNMETELWPNALFYAHQQKLPIIIANGRLSERSERQYARLGSFMKWMLSCITMVAAQSKIDGQRFLALGLDPKRLNVTGNVKFDVPLKPGVEVDSQNLRKLWGSTRLVWIAASTHHPEEEVVLKVFKALREMFPDLLLIIVPRHLERFDKVADLIDHQGYRFARRSKQDKVSPETDILLVDTLGELPLFYSAADIAFVGGSLANIGGHNTLEPALVSVPMVVGPHVHNFTDITKALSDAGALKQVKDAEELKDVLLYWLRTPEARCKAGKQGQQVVLDNRGAVEKTVKLIEDLNFSTKH